MKALLSQTYRRRLYIIASFVILGLQAGAYLALLVLWHANTLDRHLFSLSRLSLVSQVVSVVSQALAMSSLATLTFFVHGVASDRIIRRRPCVQQLSTDIDDDFLISQLKNLQQCKTFSLHGMALGRPLCRYGVADGREAEYTVNFSLSFCSSQPPPFYKLQCQPQ
jgi:hypothetical protein